MNTVYIVYCRNSLSVSFSTGPLSTAKARRSRGGRRPVAGIAPRALARALSPATAATDRARQVTAARWRAASWRWAPGRRKTRRRSTAPGAGPTAHGSGAVAARGRRRAATARSPSPPGAAGSTQPVCAALPRSAPGASVGAAPRPAARRSSQRPAISALHRQPRGRVGHDQRRRGVGQYGPDVQFGKEAADPCPHSPLPGHHPPQGQNARRRFGGYAPGVRVELVELQLPVQANPQDVDAVAPLQGLALKLHRGRPLGRERLASCAAGQLRLLRADAETPPTAPREDGP
jgi:hypothetical protein